MQINFHSHENEFNLRVNENCFAYERMSTKTHFENEAEVIRKWPIELRPSLPRYSTT